MSGPTLIARAVSKASKAIMGKYKSKARITLSRIIDHWPEIIAPEDPLIVRPIRVGWKWIGEGSDKISEGTIYIAAPSAVATKLSFQEAVIVGRMNRIFGLGDKYFIKRIAVSHDRIAPPLKKSYRVKGQITEDTQKRLNEVKDPVLREKLEGLAKAMSGSQKE